MLFKMAAAARVFPRLPVVVVLGCTGTGKSKLAIEIGKRIGGEIISADSMQVYKGLDIITNKVTPEEMAECPHHMIDFVPQLKEFSVVEFRNMALPLIEDIKARGKVPIVVGGTNYYIESLLWEILIDKERDNSSDSVSDVDTEVKKRKLMSANHGNEHSGQSLETEQDLGTSLDLYKKLVEIDPDMAKRLHPNDTRKVARSLQVFEQHGAPHSKLLAEQQEKGGNAYGGPLRFDSTCVFWLQCEREVLNERLDKRVDAMITTGLLKELLDFHTDYNRKRTDKKSRYTEGIFQSIGFKEFHSFLISQEGKEVDAGSAINDGNKKVFNECVEAMKTVTRRYARKQTTWIKNRFLGRPEGSSPNLYGLDATDLTQWKDNVLKTAMVTLEDLLQGEKPQVDPLPRSVGNPQATHTQHICEVCDNRVIIGEKNWSSHLVSKSHKWHVKKKKLEDEKGH